MRSFNTSQKILDAKATTGTGKSFQASDWDTIVLQFMSASSANCTVKVQASLSDACPDFSAAASASNPWFYVDIVDYGTNNVIAGATGIVLTGTDVINGYEVNVNGIRWINANITAISAGAVTLEANGFSTT